MKRIAVLASGRGSNFQAVIDAIASGKIPAACVVLITDNPGAYAIERAGKAGIPVKIIDFASFPTREAYEQALLAAMEEARADLYVLAGYMRILGSEVVRAFPGKMVNIHPALLPSFTGLHAQRQAVLHGVKVAGCTVHFVDDSLDGGPIILQKCVPVMDDDGEDDLADRILEQEHIAFPEAIRLFCENRLEIVGRKVRVRK
ncbi:MAG: phosphoribosylglycinamide formyltransferase [Methanoregula sp.]|jgi:phosphoribosylglycinamide formyltransferase-1|uniref:phosphoribosylglycinamide formyltransferase n=1 Tax=Methanoregula sp. TaxID=2052170 RepID=UPI0025FC3D69|nr:phosphoribosylglycinamide formyltransferase [Methanoregula sp.]MCK9630092.1 phosphoribosylglycinamide formyltransferase [Methanoregula sp.]